MGDWLLQRWQGCPSCPLRLPPLPRLRLLLSPSLPLLALLLVVFAQGPFPLRYWWVGAWGWWVPSFAIPFFHRWVLGLVHRLLPRHQPLQPLHRLSQL